MNNRVFKQIAVIASLTILFSCGEGGGGFLSGNNNDINPDFPPYITASLVSFSSGSDPGYTPNAVVEVEDMSTRTSITAATVTMNGTLLTYNPESGREAYEGNVAVSPGESVTLSVTVQGKTYTASAVQFTSYPTISAPLDGTWYASIPNTVKWSGGTPTTEAVYNLAILDAHNPYGELVWPTDTENVFKVLPISAASSQIPENSVSAGDRVILVGIVTGVSISDAYYGSEFVIAGCSSAPITVVDATLTSITVTPADPSIPLGTTQQFTATGTFSDNSSQDLTADVDWSSDNNAASMDYSLAGLARTVYTGSSIITASLAGISDSTSMTVMPASLLSIEISPNNRAIVRDTTQHFSATGHYTDGYARPITSSVVWGSSNTEVAIISNETGSNGEATAVSNGTTTISADLDGISQSAELSVTDWPSGSENRVDLQSDSGDYIGGGNSYSLTQADAEFYVSAVGRRVDISVYGQTWWHGHFEVPDSFSQLQAGYYGNLTKYSTNEAAGSMNWGGEGAGCNALTGWFAIDSVTYDAGNLTAIDLHFEQHCEGAAAALFGWIHWVM